MTKDEIDGWFSKYGRYAEARDYALLNAIEAIVAPQRTWVGLTDEEIDELSRTMVKGNKSVNWLCRAIEAKLKDSNT